MDVPKLLAIGMARKSDNVANLRKIRRTMNDFRRLSRQSQEIKARGYTPPKQTPARKAMGRALGTRNISAVAAGLGGLARAIAGARIKGGY